jgi:uncharacterized protein (TIGR03435 family)
MQELEDMALLREYIERDSEEAFAMLVTRHINKVYSVALRHTGNPHSAEEITQAVFVILAQKAGRLGRRVILSGWLYQTARLTAVTFIRSAIRRAHREQEVCMQSVANENECDAWPEIAPLLDEAMAHLSETDRNAIVLRYFDGKSLKQVGVALGLNEEAAKKRVNRALEKLRIFFTKRGVRSTTAILAGTISANSVQAAPVYLAKAASAAAMAKGAATGSSTSPLIKGTLKLMAWTKLKVAALTGVGILLASGTAIIADKTIHPATPNADAERIWNLYSQVFALGLSGPETRDAAVQVMTSHPPMALIRLSQIPRPGQTGLGRPGRMQGIMTFQGRVEMGASLVEVLRDAYGLDPKFPQNRIIVPRDLASSRYDLIDTMPQGGGEGLQRALKDRFGLVAKRVIRENLVLTVKNPAAGLHQHTESSGSETGGFKSSNVTMASFANGLSKILGVEVTDQTGLSGGFDYSLNAPYPPTADEIKKALLDQLGLELTPAADNQHIEFLVAEKVQ